MEERQAAVTFGPRTPTIVRGVLRLGDLGHDPKSPGGFRSCPASLVDAAGRKVLELHIGANDVRRLSPGVYFVRPASGVTRVVVTR